MLVCRHVAKLFFFLMAPPKCVPFLALISMRMPIIASLWDVLVRLSIIGNMAHWHWD